MYDLFENLPEEKKKRIIDACLEEFSKMGYTGASTNEIVKKAGISKGLLFHYFGNKKNLYLYILDKAIEHTMSRFRTECGKLPADLFDRIAHIGMVRIRLGNEEPAIYELLFNSFYKMPEELRDEMTQRYERINKEQVPPVLEGLDLSKLRYSIKPEMAISTVLIFLEGLQSRYINPPGKLSAGKIYSDRDAIFKEIMEYMEILKKGIYTK